VQAPGPRLAFVTRPLVIVGREHERFARRVDAVTLAEHGSVGGHKLEVRHCPDPNPTPRARVGRRRCPSETI
jgi:hypothetical protein